MLGDGVAALFFPFPHFRHEVFARFGRGGAHVVAANTLGLQLAFHHDLGGDTSVVGTWHPRRVVALHAVVARQAVHNGLVKRVAHVQSASHVRGRQLDGKVMALGCGVGAGLASATETCMSVATGFPFWAPTLFDGSRFKRFSEAVQAWLL